MTTNCDIRSMLSVFFPFWRILSDGMPWILLTAVLSLLLDGAVLIFVLLVCRPRRGRIGDADVGNVWRRTVLLFSRSTRLPRLRALGSCVSHCGSLRASSAKAPDILPRPPRSRPAPTF